VLSLMTTTHIITPLRTANVRTPMKLPSRRPYSFLPPPHVHV